MTFDGDEIFLAAEFLRHSWPVVSVGCGLFLTSGAQVVKKLNEWVQCQLDDNRMVLIYFKDESWRL